jgi:hypothetical protein
MAIAIIIVLACLIGATNPADRAGMVTNEPFLFGEKGKVLKVVIGPSS